MGYTKKKCLEAETPSQLLWLANSTEKSKRLAVEIGIGSGFGPRPEGIRTATRIQD